MNNGSDPSLIGYIKASLRCDFWRLTSSFCWISDSLLWTTPTLIFQILEHLACLAGGFCRSSIKIMLYTRPMTRSLLGVLYLFTEKHIFQMNHLLMFIATVDAYEPNHSRVSAIWLVTWGFTAGKSLTYDGWRRNPFKIPQPSGGVSFKKALYESLLGLLIRFLRICIMTSPYTSAFSSG